MSFEEMYEKCGEIYYGQYADGEYCHEQSFRWGFQEAWELFEDSVKGVLKSHLQEGESSNGVKYLADTDHETVDELIDELSEWISK